IDPRRDGRRRSAPGHQQGKHGYGPENKCRKGSAADVLSWWCCRVIALGGSLLLSVTHREPLIPAASNYHDCQSPAGVQQYSVWTPTTFLRNTRRRAETPIR